MLSCKQVIEEADYLLAGELSAMQRLKVRFHLLMCRHCRRYVQQLRVLVGTLAKLHRKAGPDEVTKVMDRVRRGK